MARRVALIGRIADAEGRRTGFPELRTRAFAQALQEAGHALRIVGLRPSEEAGEALPPGVEQAVVEEGAGWLEEIARASADAEILVAAGPFNAGRAACRVAGERPVWVDLPGDPFAELEAVAEAEGGVPEARRVEAEAVALQVLGRADAIGVVSERQLYMVQGQLGLLGRLGPPSPTVALSPVAWHFPTPERPFRQRPARSPLRVLLMGSANAWLDIEAMLAGLDLAMARQPGIEVWLGEGDLPLHHPRGGARLRAWAEARPRVRRLPRLPDAELSLALEPAHLGLFVDRPVLEAATGSRTRALFWLHQGLRVLATTRTELCARLARDGLLVPLASAAPEALAAALLRLHEEPWQEGPETARRQLAEELAPSHAAAALLRFVQDPRRARGRPSPHLELALDRDRLREDLRRVHESPTWRLSARLRALRHPRK